MKLAGLSTARQLDPRRGPTFHGRTIVIVRFLLRGFDLGFVGDVDALARSEILGIDFVDLASEWRKA